MISPGDRARNAMLGLAMGDALSWPAMFHRSRLLPPWTRRLRREMDAESETSHVLAMAMPFSLNQPAMTFDLGPTGDAEWAAFTTKILIVGGHNFEDALLDAWLDLASSGEEIRGGVSTQAALTNLRKGITPPRSGRENPHYFDDGAAVRAVPIGAFCAGNPGKAAHMAVLDASITNAEDGVWAAQAMAVAISLACVGGNADRILDGAQEFLPPSSLIRRNVDAALALAEGSSSLFSILPRLQDTCINHEYSYGDAASETLALTFVIAKMEGNDFDRAVTTAASLAKTADSLPAMVGALVGAMSPGPIASDHWRAAIATLKGICIPSLAGVGFLGLTDQLVDVASKNPLGKL